MEARGRVQAHRVEWGAPSFMFQKKWELHCHVLDSDSGGRLRFLTARGLLPAAPALLGSEMRVGKLLWRGRGLQIHR